MNTNVNVSFKINPFNATLIVVGLIMLCIGLFRTFPVKLDVKFAKANVPYFAALLVIIFVTCQTMGTSGIVKGVNSTLAVSSGFLIMLLVLMPLIGFGGGLAEYFQKYIVEAIKGPLGYFWGIVTGFAAPGGNSLSGALNTLWNSSPELRPRVIFMLSTVPLTSFSIYMIRALGLNAEVAWEMYKVNWGITVFLILPAFIAYEKFVAAKAL